MRQGAECRQRGAASGVGEAQRRGEVGTGLWETASSIPEQRSKWGTQR